MKQITAAIKRTALGRVFSRWRLSVRAEGEIRRWETLGRPAPPPHAVKVATVRAYARRFATPVLVETGTFMGDMVAAVQDDFQEIFSIEIDGSLYEQARSRFHRHHHIHLLNGNSARILLDILPRLNN